VSAWEKELDRAKLRSEMRRDVSVSEAAEV
jgi:aerobic C4-dicarboxylate transport protein